jgi:hypothetical protein
MSDDKLTPADHVVRPGDHLSRVAATFGFRSYGPLWNDPDNAKLRARNPNPNTLAVGDWVHVPERIDREVERSTEQRHRFRAELHPLDLGLELRDWDRQPRKDAVTEVLLDGKPEMFVQAGPGAIVVPVGPQSDRCRVTIGADEVTVRIGFLQPAETAAGCRQRLNNLGYDAGDKDDPTAAPFRSAVEEFQCDHGLAVDGKVGPATRARLVKEHGT